MRNGKRIVVNNNFEIDYDRLADAIVRAEARAKEPAKSNDGANKKKLWPSVWSILKGETSKDGRFLSAPFAFILSIVFRTIAVFGTLSILIFDFSVVYTLIKADWQGALIAANIFNIIISIAINVSGFLYMVVFWGAANDIEHEKDKNYVISVFSGLVSVAALIVAIVALGKGL